MIPIDAKTRRIHFASCAARHKGNRGEKQDSKPRQLGLFEEAPF
jgi:hypothetical protein